MTQIHRQAELQGHHFSTLCKPPKCLRSEVQSLLLKISRNDKSLTHVRIEKRTIADRRAQQLADALVKNSIITALELHKNNLTANGIHTLATALQGNITIHDLRVTHNKVSDIGCEELFMAFACCGEAQHMKHLSLRSNKISDKGAKNLAKALRDNETLTILDLAGNDITDDGVPALAEALNHNTVMTELNLSDNHITDVGLAFFETALRTNKKMRTLSLWGNDIEMDAAPGHVYGGPQKGSTVWRRVDRMLEQNRKGYAE